MFGRFVVGGEGEIGGGGRLLKVYGLFKEVQPPCRVSAYGRCLPCTGTYQSKAAELASCIDASYPRATGPSIT